MLNITLQDINKLFSFSLFGLLFLMIYMFIVYKTNTTRHCQIREGFSSRKDTTVSSFLYLILSCIKLCMSHKLYKIYICML